MNNAEHSLFLYLCDGLTNSINNKHYWKVPLLLKMATKENYSFKYNIILNRLKSTNVFSLLKEIKSIRNEIR